MAKIIKVRVNEDLKRVVSRLCKDLKVSESEFGKMCILYFLLGLFTGELNKSYSDLKEEFLKMYGNEVKKV